MTGGGSAMQRQLEDRERECRVLRQRCADLERQLAAEQVTEDKALQVVFAAGEESARIQLGLPARQQPPPRRRGHLRGLSAIVLVGMLATIALHTAAHMGMRTVMQGHRAHLARRPYATTAPHLAASHTETSLPVPGEIRVTC